MQELGSLLDVTVLFALVLALALLVERLFEILKSLYDFVDSRQDFYKFWTKRAQKLAGILEKKMNVFEYAKPRNVAAVLRGFRELLLNEQSGYTGTVPVLSGDLVRTVSVRSILKIIGILIGIGLAFWFEIDLIAIWQNTNSELTKSAMNVKPTALGLILSGIAIGLGSGPVHKIITTIERKREKQRKKGGKS